jgi:hypothetical protein
MTWLIAPGCGTDEFRHAVYPAGGMVRSQGQPVADAVVRFHPVDPNVVKIPEGRQGYPIANPTTETSADGTFRLSTYLADDGVPAGDYKVTVLVGAGQKGDADAGEEADPDAEGSDAPARKAPPSASKYRDPDTTPLRVTVKPDAENRFVFDLD